VRKGTTVIIRPLTLASSSTSLPKYAVRGMLKSFGLPGIVLDVDQVS
jgi:E3 ubiquitin-protein ligase HECTD4